MSGPGRDGRTRIKICGVTSVEIAQVAAEAGADFIGLMFVPDSPRCITPEQAREIASSLSQSVTPISVFRDAVIEDIDEAPAGGVQLHGNEPESFINQIVEACTFDLVTRAFAIDGPGVRRWNACSLVDVLLIEGAAPGVGQGFEHERLVKLMPALTKPVILAGGLTPDNVGDAIQTVQPWGVDVSSGVESSHGVKDASLIRKFCNAVREADRALDTSL